MGVESCKIMILGGQLLNIFAKMLKKSKTIISSSSSRSSSGCYINTALSSTQTGWRRSVVVSVLASINAVNKHWARLVLGWVTTCGRVNHLGM